MIVSDFLQEISQILISVLTPIERWSAARRLSGGSSAYMSRYEFILAASATMAVLILLLWWISHRRRRRSGDLTRELFAENAVRRGLSARDRQILLAIVMRSGLGRSHDIFTTVDAFDRGAAKLLAECARTRTVEENERLKTEVAYLRERLGFRAVRSLGGMVASRRPSSRDIPVGKIVEVTRRRRHHAEDPLRAEVVRNDDLELAVELEKPVETRAGDLWCARYAFGVYVWEFDTTAVSCSQTRLVLNHTDDVRFVNRRRFPRVATRMPALVAGFPFARRDSWEATPQTGPDRIAGSLVPDVPEFVSGTITELAGPGLRIELPRPFRPGERVLVIFRPTGGAGDALVADERCVFEDVGLVRHSRVTSTEVSIAVELSGLNESEIDEMVRLTNAVASRAGARDEADDAEAEPAKVAADGAPVGQGV